jgi:hypothetical protein
MAERLNTQNIGDNQVTYGKLQQATASSVLLGAQTTGTNISEIALGTNLSMTGSVLNAAGGSSTPSVAPNNGDITFTHTDNKSQLGCNPSAVHVYTLDNTFSAGDVFTFYNISNSWGSYCYVEANNGTVIGILPPLGKLVAVCLNSSPAGNGDWSVQQRDSNWVPYTPTFVSFGTVSGLNFSARLDRNNMIVHGNFTAGSPSASVGYLTIPAPFNIDTSNVINSTSSQVSSFSGTYQNGSAIGNCGNVFPCPASVANAIYFSITFNSGQTSVGGLIAYPIGSVIGGGQNGAVWFTVPVLF